MSVTGAEVIAEVRKVAEGNPDFVYGKGIGGSCSYFGKAIGDPTGQRCIIGQALANLEVDMSKVLDEETSDDPQCVGSEIRFLISGEVVDIVAGSAEISWLSLVQDRQDRGLSWSEAVMIADRDVRL